MTFHLMCVHIIFSSVSVGKWPAALSVDTCSLCILTISNRSYFPFWF